MKGLIVVSQKEAHRANVLQQVDLQSLSLKEAAEIMQVSYRQARRLFKRWGEDGLEGLAHRNRGRPVEHAFAVEDEAIILALHEQAYASCNDTHFTELLAEREGIVVSREKVRQILRAAGKPPKRKRRTKKHHARRPRKSQAGQMMQWDGSPHHWFGHERPACCLMAAVDDAGSKLLAALFAPAESSLAYLRLLDMVLRRHGIPLSAYQDRHRALTRADDYWSVEEQLRGEQYPTHVGRVLEELQITPISALSPQAKGRVERCFGVQQDRLIAEMELDGITDIEQANPWLEAVYIDRHNKRFAIAADEPGHAFRKISKQKRYETIAFAYEATVGNDNCVRLGGMTIDVPPGKGRRSFARVKVLVKQHLDGCWSVNLGEQVIAKHEATPLVEPVRSWKRRKSGGLKRGRSMMQVYINSKPAHAP